MRCLTPETVRSRTASRIRVRPKRVRLKFAAVQTWRAAGRIVREWLDPTAAQPISAIARDPAPPQS